MDSSLVGLLSLVFLGFFLGVRHAADPDHIIAITTIVSRHHTLGAAALIGCAWGVGHTVTILLVGGAIIIFQVAVPPTLGLTMEFAVALMLVLLGVLNLTGTMQWIRDVLAAARWHAGGFHSHAHGHGDYAHSHPHGHGPGDHGHGEDETPPARLDQRFGRLVLYRALRPLIVGVIHGLAGSAAIALLVLTTIQNPVWALSYLLLFGAGTIAGMMLITVSIAAPLAYTATRLARATQYLTVASGLVSVAFGLFLVYHIGFVQGLFTGDPQWTPW
ncbi:MAG: high-affinity nickel-transport family protein [Candidatus Rokubacteria bacterium 13_1_40CM_4_69_5]|nr:MAG: high-affinity nickel-transport family protein [Candidatus Rokubacteria bacterium 13_1_40CM_4_69_5]